MRKQLEELRGQTKEQGGDPHAGAWRTCPRSWGLRSLGPKRLQAGPAQTGTQTPEAWTPLAWVHMSGEWSPPGRAGPLGAQESAWNRPRSPEE